MTAENHPEEATREPVLSPVDRVSEMLFGLFMALTFVGAVSVAESGDTQIRALLQPGTSFGLTDVQLAVTEAPRNTLQFFTDNQGVKSTGRYQAGTYYRSSGALGFDDRFTF